MRDATKLTGGRGLWPALTVLVGLGAAAACGGGGGEAGAAEDTTSMADTASEAMAAAEEPAPSEADRSSSDSRSADSETSPPRRRTAPARTTPEPEPAPEPEPEPRMATLEPGVTFSATLNEELSTQTNQVGDTFTATVSGNVVRSGETVVPEGARLEGEVTAVQKSGKAGEAAVLKLNFSRVSFRDETYPVQLAITEANPEVKSRTTTGEAAGRIGIGAAAGAVLGRVIGGDAKGTLIGAAVGAAAGTAVVLTTQDADAVLPAGSPMTLRLEETLVVKLPPEGS